MRIIMPTLEPLEWMPPTINLIKKLSALGHEVVCITLFPSNYLENLNISGVTNIALAKKDCTITNRIPYIRGISGIFYRIDKIIKSIIAHKLGKIVNRELSKGGFLWVVNEMTVMLAGTNFLKNKRFAFIVYELHEKKFYARNIQKAAKLADIVIVPEYNRAHIMQSRYKLRKTPYVLPNKSDIQLEKDIPDDAAEAIKLIEEKKSEGKKIILYMGGINKERPLDDFLDVICKDNRYLLAVIGRHTLYLETLLNKYGNHIVNLGAYNPPIHLLVAKHADVGLLNYVSISEIQGLNALFCAPNKIYEYTGLGLPVIGNDIPGLRAEIMYSKAGKIVDFSNKYSVLEALDSIFEQYSDYSDNAKKYYNSVNIDEILSKILAEIKYF